ncbi:unnamed protein product [Rhizophagus irregularis]|nr:unnamed protein product [Rhizophagus irregularis]
MGIIGSAKSSNKAVRCSYIEAILLSAIYSQRYHPAENVLRSHCQEVLGIMRNVMQLESSYHTNKRKRKASEAFDDDFNYLHGIVTTATDWYFIMYTPERIYCTKADYHIDLTEDILDDDAKLCQGVK